MKHNEILRKIREELHLSQKEFAEILGYNFRTMSNWELGKRVPSIFIYQKINKKLGVSYDELFDFEEE